MPSHAFDKNISSQKTFPTKKYSTTPIKPSQNTGWWPWLKTKFFAEKQPKTYNLDLVKIKTPQNNNNTTSSSYWKQALAAIAALLAGGTIAHMEEEKPDDILNQEQFKDLREFIKLVGDPELKKRWEECRSHEKCNEVIRNANFITLINRNNNPYMTLKDHQFDRVINAQLAQDVIEKNNLNLIGIPKKTILFDGNSWKIVTEKVEGYHPTTLSLEQIQQLTKFVLETGYRDLHEENILYNEQSKKLFIIDTEDRSFSHHTKSYLLDYLIDNFDASYVFDDPARIWLNDQKKLYLNPEKGNTIPNLEMNEVLNRGLNLEKIRKQAHKYATLVNKSYVASARDLTLRGLEVVNLED